MAKHVRDSSKEPSQKPAAEGRIDRGTRDRAAEGGRNRDWRRDESVSDSGQVVRGVLAEAPLPSWWSAGRRRVVGALYAVFDEDAEVREVVGDPRRVEIAFGVSEYGLDQDFVPDSRFRTALKRLILRAFKQEGEAAFDALPAPYDGAGLLQVHVVVRRLEEQRADRRVQNEVVKAFNLDVADKVEALPVAYGARREALGALNDAVRHAIAKSLEPVLNERAASMPHATYEEKKKLAKWVNAELRRFGLALKSDRTDCPCILVGNPGNRPETGRFMLQYADDRGKLHHPLTSVTLPPLELVLDDLTRASYAEKGRGR